MKTNVGGIDRILRIAVGALLIVLAALHVVGAWGYIGVLLVLSGLFRFCPAYLPFGMSTCTTRTASESK
jgi:Protein of unknown function (DUF2892)